MQLHRRAYGKGPTKAKTYLLDDVVFCVLEGGALPPFAEDHQVGQTEVAICAAAMLKQVEVYSFELATPVAREFDPERVVFDRQGGLLFESEEALVLGWIGHVDLWIAAANTQVAADEAAEKKRRAEAQTREERDLLLSRINEKFKNL